MVRRSTEKLILSLDQGTTNSKALVFTPDGDLVSSATRSIEQHYPHAGWVEEDPELIWRSILEVARKAIRNVPLSAFSNVAITNQRETIILWDRKTLKPVSPAIIWQDRRGFGICEQLREDGYSELIWDRTGLVIDPYFSAPKILWLLERHPWLRKRAEGGEICFGTVDSFLISRLTDGAVHATDFTNASRTMLFDINKRCWDDELLKLLRIPSDILPEAKPSAHIFGEVVPRHFGKKLPIAAAMGDQQASLFGQAIFKPGTAKNTYGTGCFLLSVTGEQRKDDPNKHLISTIAWGIDDEVTYALEGSVPVAGSSLRWLEEGLGLDVRLPEIRRVSQSLGKNDDVYFVPALSGLGAPVWDFRARGTILGITFGTSKLHLLRAGLEAICYQSRDVLIAFEETIGRTIHTLRADGGASANDELMQFQADILGREVQRSRVKETTALGAALMAGLSMGVWKDLEELEKIWRPGKVFSPNMNPRTRERLCEKWSDAVSRARSWAAE
ncbi:MAG TPA: glycerol kinase GlpK [Nitrososphaerales archaeon]|nr:glycerol kinase GlpK [Nitrososphaerales archaeon]